MKVQVLGTGCPKCKLLLERVESAARDEGLGIELTKVTEIQEILAFGVLSTPALVIDDKLIFSGKVPDVLELRTLLTSHSNS
jgi:small redox-active disulfide protein 2